ncbi:MAG: methyltransferase domain-containing protein [Candidatus Gygaella obscura]|nr:methyltransferase domain-containing protein [Candidatus Gygaella obscura]
MNIRKEKEVFGVNYERFALGRKLKLLKEQLKINSVCEIPAHGAKAAPSLYSLDFALAGAKVMLVNGDKNSEQYYKKLNISENVDFSFVDDILCTGFEDNTFDFVWSLGFIAEFNKRNKLLEEMKRISKRYVAFCSVNNKNIGFYLHRFAHFRTKIPWTHGDIRFNSPYFMKKFMEKNGLKNVQIGLVDCPVWPDSVGFRDIRLHRMNKVSSEIVWEVPYVEYVKNNRFPKWFDCVYFIECLPLPLVMKFLYAHLFYVVGEK